MEKHHRIRVELIGPEGRVGELNSCGTSLDIADKGFAAIQKAIEAVGKETEAEDKKEAEAKVPA